MHPSHVRNPVFVAVLVAILLSSTGMLAQYQPAAPDNMLTNSDAVGVPPQASTSGTHETVNNGNGSVNLFIPVLSLPQRGGSNLTLGYVYNSFTYSRVQNVSTSVTNQCGNPACNEYNYTYTESLVDGVNGPALHVNIPQLQFSIEYMGFTPVDTMYATWGVIATYCATNFVFTDWDGNRHQFTNIPACNVSHSISQYGPGDPTVPSNITDSTDGSWMRLDTSNFTDIKLISKHGTVYHFTGASNPFSTCSTYCTVNGNTTPDQTLPFSSMSDPNGNTITYSGTTLTDTIGRTISVASGGPNNITYTDSSGQAQTFAVTGSSSSTQSYSAYLHCVPNQNQGPGTFLTIHDPGGAYNLSRAPYSYIITLPVADGAHARTYNLQFDGMDRLTQVTYPAGGYTKYDYQEYNEGGQTEGQLNCTQSLWEIAHKRECTLSAGACTSDQELVTTYTPDVSVGVDGTVYNSAMTETAPTGDYTVYGFTDESHISSAWPPSTAPMETLRGYYNSAGALKRSIQTGYTPYINYYDIQVPSQTTTTLDNGQASIQTFQYQYQTLTERDTSVTAPIDNATQVDDYDYAPTGTTGTHLRSTTNTWKTGGNYDISTGHILDRLTSRTITDPVTNVQSVTSFSYDLIGNVTSKTRSGTGVSAETTSYQRNAYGQVTQVTDPLQHPTTFDYTDNWKQTTCAPSGNSSAYITSVTNALGQTSKYSYYSCTGLVGSSQDPNDIAANRPGTIYNYDALERATSVSFPDGGQTIHSFVDSLPNKGTESVLMSAGAYKTTTTILDGFGRTIQTQLTTDPEGTDFVDTGYDSRGRVYSVSNPHRSTASPATDGTTLYSYDLLGRVSVVTEQDGSVVQSDYSGNCTTVTDEIGRKRTSCTDALGRLTGVWEDPSVRNYETDYKYDTLGNLTCVEQHGGVAGDFGCSDSQQRVGGSWRVRRFTYDSLSRLLTAKNPESESVTYTYDANGNVSTKVDSRNINTSYLYDSLNRLVAKGYTGIIMPTVYFGYDESSVWGATLANGIGRLTHTWVNGIATAYSYDSMGRTSTQWVCLPLWCPTPNGPITALYDLAGNMTSLNYPSGRTLSNQYTGAGRLNNVQAAGYSYLNVPTGNASNPSTWGYSPGGAAEKFQYGNGVVDLATYNPRLQLSLSETWSPGGSRLMSQGFNLTDPVTGHNNGNVWAKVDNLNSGRTQNFQYDPLNRISSASTTALTGPDAWAQTFTPDAWGNMQQSGTLSFTQSFDSNNRISTSGYLYDAAGNLTHDATIGHNYAYDGENRITSVDSGADTYLYDVYGNRIQKQAGAANTDYVYFGGQVIAEFASGANAWTDYIYANGKRIARATGASSAGTTYYHSDNLGTARMETDASGNVVSNCTYLPFGAQFGCSPDDAANHYKFTGKERDTETGLDYFGARYYGSTMGRFMTPDWNAVPVPVPYADLADPQSLNQYSYVRNDPLSRLDPDGHLSCADTSGNTQGSCPDEDPQAKSAKTQNPPSDQGLTNVVYNETGSLRADPNAKPGSPGSTEDLANGRQAVAEIANRVIDAGHPDKVAPSVLTNRGAQAVKNDASAKDVYGKSRTAADVALNGSNISNGATQYRTRVGTNVRTPVGRSRHNRGTPVSQHYGPFIEGHRKVVIVVAQ